MSYVVLKEITVEGKSYKPGDMIRGIRLDGLVESGFLKALPEKATREEPSTAAALVQRLRGKHAGYRRAGS